MGQIDKKNELELEHKTQTFLNKLSEANNQNLNVISSRENHSIEILDMNAIKKMQKVLFEKKSELV